MKTIVDRLRQFPGGVGAEALCREAADEIERLRTALKQIADDPYTNADDNFSFASEALKRSPVEPSADALGEQIYALLVRRGYAQHEAHLIAGGPGCISDCVQKGYPEQECPKHGALVQSVTK